MGVVHKTAASIRDPRHTRLIKEGYTGQKGTHDCTTAGQKGICDYTTAGQEGTHEYTAAGRGGAGWRTNKDDCQLHVPNAEKAIPGSHRPPHTLHTDSPNGQTLPTPRLPHQKRPGQGAATHLTPSKQKRPEQGAATHPTQKRPEQGATAHLTSHMQKRPCALRASSRVAQPHACACSSTTSAPMPSSDAGTAGAERRGASRGRLFESVWRGEAPTMAGFLSHGGAARCRPWRAF
eukprot:366266-Chlamydomonas_euryale.AAC.4